MKDFSLYTRQEYDQVRRLRLKYIWALVISLLIMVIANVLIVVFRHQIGRSLAQALNIIITVLYLCGAWFFLSIKFRLTHKYYKTLKNIFTGLVEENTGKFLHFDDTITQKDGVDYYLMILEERVIKRPDMPQRRVLIRKDLEHPPFSEGDIIKYRTHASILLDYKIIKKAEEN
ncbi:MAG: hypothetical protein GX756_00225 [Clostridiales bacterium]|nr:hypothetical protein [Clostridiales bacterium]